MEEEKAGSMESFESEVRSEDRDSNEMETDSTDSKKRSNRTSGQALRGTKMIKHKGRLRFVEEIGKDDYIRCTRGINQHMSATK